MAFGVFLLGFSWSWTLSSLAPEPGEAVAFRAQDEEPAACWMIASSPNPEGAFACTSSRIKDSQGNGFRSRPGSWC